MELESPKRRNASSPEFEFWMVGKNSPKLKPNLHTADELFIDGVLLPLHLLPSPKPNTSPQPNPASVSPTSPVPDSDINPASESPPSTEPDTPAPQPSILSSSNLISSKRWKDIFRKKDQNNPTGAEKKKDRKGNVSNSSAIAAELNIKIWPFSRSRSAGTAAVGPKAAAAAAAMRKSNSAPCSRSNSRRSAPSPGRAGMGVYVGRSSPVWQARRVGKGPVQQKGKGGVNLNLNVNSCIGYGGSQVRCGSEDGGSGGGLIKFKGLFTKKVY